MGSRWQIQEDHFDDDDDGDWEDNNAEKLSSYEDDDYVENYEIEGFFSKNLPKT
ncbi:unnamed protein product [Gongylonema pulchrum]|uniref:TIP_N domain-containing protein n=1 Tax=Gongylonema pulchrum TaxID=637853 RepID=A0A183DUY4_9BILA|nr:unnamed protein product [Gongylonema pulchrum]